MFCGEKASWKLESKGYIDIHSVSGGRPKSLGANAGCNKQERSRKKDRQKYWNIKKNQKQAKVLEQLKNQEPAKVSERSKNQEQAKVQGQETGTVYIQKLRHNALTGRRSKEKDRNRNTTRSKTQDKNTG